MNAAQVGDLGEGVSGGVAHADNGQDDFICRKSQQEPQQNHAVQSDELCRCVQKCRTVCKNGAAANMAVGEAPDHGSRRGRRQTGSAQYKNRPVQQRTHQHLAELGLAVRWQFQRKGGRHTPQNGMRQQTGHGECDKNAQQDQPQQQQGRTDRMAQPAAGGEKQGNTGDHGGESAVAGDKVVGENGDQPFPRGVDNAAAGHAGGVAAEAHAHGQSLFAAGTGTLKRFIQMKRHTGQIAKILQQGEQGKENRHRRQHDCNDTGQHVVDAVDQQTVQPVGRMYGFQQQREPALQMGKAGGEPCRGIICPHNGEPEHQPQQQQHHRNAPLSRQNPVKAAVGGIGLFRLVYSLGGESFAVSDNGGDHGIGTDFGGVLLPRLFQCIGQCGDFQGNIPVGGNFFVQFRLRF